MYLVTLNLYKVTDSANKRFFSVWNKQSAVTVQFVRNIVAIARYIYQSMHPLDYPLPSQRIWNAWSGNLHPIQNDHGCYLIEDEKL